MLRKILIAYVGLLLIGCQQHYNDKNGWEELSLKGKVMSTQDVSFEAKVVNGSIVRTTRAEVTKYQNDMFVLFDNQF